MRVALLVTASCFFLAAPCLAQDAQAGARTAVHIPAQELAKALQAFARAAGLQIVYRSDVVRGLQSTGASGEFTADEALAQLLEGTGLTFRYLDSKTLTVVSAAGAASLAKGPNQTDAGQKMQLEEVLVTAQKFVEVASKAPLALGVYSGQTLKREGVSSVSDLQYISTAMSVGRSPAGVNIAIRGVTTTDNTSKGDQGIVFNVDGVPLGRPREMGLAFFDLERIEVLRGPQGTLYGKSSTGGVINVITNKPQNFFDAAASLEFGNYNTRRGEAMVNLPVTDAFSVRAAANFNVDDGYLKPVINNFQASGGAPARNDQDDRSARLSGLWKLGDAASLLVTGTFGRVGGVGPSTALVLIDSSSALRKIARTKSGPAAREVYFNPFSSAIDEHFANYTAELNMELGAAHLTYIGAKLWFDAHDLTSTTSNPLGRNGNYGWTNYRGSYDTDSHELRFSNALPERIDWVAGANYYNEDIQENDHSWNAPIASPNVAASLNNTGILGNTSHRSTGLFAQANWHATEALKLTLGLRRSSDSVRRPNVTFAAGPGPAPNVPWPDPQGRPCVAPADCVGASRTGNQSDSKFTYRLGADYQLVENQMTYFSVATGYKAGGFNDFELPAGGSGPHYASELLTAYEAGYKGQLLPNLQFDSAAFYYDYSKNQISSAVNINGIGILYTRAVPTVIYGWENELHYKMSEADSLDAALSLEKSRYKSLTVGFNYDVDWSGYSLDRTPAVAATLVYAHRWFARNGAYYEARASSRYNSGYFISDFVGGVQYQQQAFMRSDVALIYNSGSGRFSVQAYVRNIENKLQLLNAPQNVSAVPDSSNAPVSEPRQFGVRINLGY